MIVIKKKTLNKQNNFGNKGQELESSINDSNKFYNENNIAYIDKKPTPIKVSEVKGKLITKAFYEKQSTLDYSGIYKKRYIEFEAKSTKSTTSLPYENIKRHQFEHLDKIYKLGGISFLLIEFSVLNEYYVLSYEQIMKYYSKSLQKSIKREFILKYGYKIKQGYHPRLYYLDCVDKLLK